MRVYFLLFILGFLFVVNAKRSFGDFTPYDANEGGSDDDDNIFVQRIKRKAKSQNVVEPTQTTQTTESASTPLELSPLQSEIPIEQPKQVSTEQPHIEEGLSAMGMKSDLNKFDITKELPRTKRPRAPTPASQDDESDDMRDADPVLKITLKEREKVFKETFDFNKTMKESTLDFEKIRELLTGTLPHEKKGPQEDEEIDVQEEKGVHIELRQLGQSQAELMSHVPLNEKLNQEKHTDL